MVEIFDAFLKALANGGFTSFAIALFIFILGFVSGWNMKKYLIKETFRYEKEYLCLLRGDSEFDDKNMIVPVAFKNDKITRIDCPFVKKGICNKSNDRCLIHSTLV
ncbi:hypothetical protein [Campylobacter concisus]|uniref:hypothetical protein n=1 Tax=Campylobacter concisus TaxID=199 RepID=UPI00131DBAF7|nr:hypothetical protein [Campylobacter concisus]QPH88775.1 hypothetical protein CVT15_08740 [Campylobacter concisus]